MAKRVNKEPVEMGRLDYLKLGVNKHLKNAFFTKDGNPLVDNRGFIDLTKWDPAYAWRVAKDAVNYHVQLVDTFFGLPTGALDSEGLPEIRLNHAVGETASGKEKTFRLVVVDKFRQDDYKVVESVTDKYETFNLVEIYDAFKKALETSENQHRPVSLYVSGNGGAQKLVVEIVSGVKAPRSVPDEVTMKIALCTSVDASRAHSMDAHVCVKQGDGDIDLILGAVGKRQARHTKNIAGAVQDYFPKLVELINGWNDRIVPLLTLLYKTEFERTVLSELVQKAVEKTELGLVHQGKGKDENGKPDDKCGMRYFYETSQIRTKAKKTSLAYALIACYQYVDDVLESRDLKERVRPQLARAFDAQLTRLVPEYNELK